MKTELLPGWSNSLFRHCFAAGALCACLCAPGARAALITAVNQANGLENAGGVLQSAFFNSTPTDVNVLTNVVTTTTVGYVGGNLGAGDGNTTTCTGTFSITGNSTSAGGWINNNKVPAGVTLTFQIEFTVNTPEAGAYLTTQGESGTQLGNGIGITQFPATTGLLEPGETLVISDIKITGYSFSGLPTEPGYIFTPGAVQNPKWNRLRSNNFVETSAGATATAGSDVWGFGLATGNKGSNIAIENNFTGNGTFITAGPMTIATTTGAWNLKGLGFQYDITYEIQGEPVTPTWTGGAADASWSSVANWTGGLAPTNGQPIRFGAPVKQTSTNDLAGLVVDLITFTNGGFNLSGNAITNLSGVANNAGNNTLSLNVNLASASARTFNIAPGTQLSIAGQLTSYGALALECTGGGTLNLVNGGRFDFGPDSANANFRVGLQVGVTNVLNVGSGGTVFIRNAPTGANANRLRLGANTGSAGIVNINSGGAIIAPDDAGNPTRSLIDLGQSGGAVAVLNLNAGGRLHAQRVECNNVNASAIFNFNGGLLEAHKISGSTTYFEQLDFVRVQAGGAIIHTTNAITSLLPLTADPGSPGGGLTKLGPGTLVLPFGNTYAGPTIVSNGTFSTVLPLASSSLTLRSNASVLLTVSNASWNVSSATLDDLSAITMDFGPDYPLVVPLITDTLALNGTVVINVQVGMLFPGSFPLIDYNTITGAGQLKLGSRPTGALATLVTNTANSTIDLQVTAIANELVWTGNLNSDWDIDTTANWDLLNGGGPATYKQPNGFGDMVSFANGALNPAITLKANVSPSKMTFDNSSTDFQLQGAGFGIHGPGALLVQGGGSVTLATSNSFSGGTSNTLGFIELGNDAALGVGSLVLFAGQTGLQTIGLRSDSPASRTLTNAVLFRSFSNNETDFKLGDATKTGKLIFQGPIGFAARRSELALESDVEFSGILSDGCFSKTGPGTLRLSGTGNFSVTDQVLAQGDTIIDGGTWNNEYGLRLVALDGMTSRLVLTNNGTIRISDGGNLRVAAQTSGSFGQGTGTNIFIMYSGEVDLNGGTGEASIGNTASLSSYGRIELRGGLIALRGLRGLTNGGPTELVLDGVTVRNSTNGGARLGNFISGFTNASVLAGGAVLDVSEGFYAVVAQSFEGAGGFAKTGPGTIYFDGSNTCTGTMAIQAGTFGGTGLISGPVTIGAGATLSPGSSPAIGVFTSIGALSISNSLSLAGTAFMEIDKGTLAADLVTGVSAISYGGALVVSNVSATAFSGGEVVKLFEVSGAKTGTFSSITILPDTGLTGSFNPQTGELTIGAATPPVIGQPVIANGNLILTASGLAPNATYSVLVSPDVAAPLSLWTTNLTGIADGAGILSNAIPVGTEGRTFYLLKTP